MATDVMDTKEKKILAVARDLFLKHRYGEVTLDAVCRDAGVGKGTIYRHFRNKEDLYFHTLLHGFDELIRSLNGAAERTESAGSEPSQGEASGGESKLLALARKKVRFFESARPLFALLQSEELRGSPRRKQIRAMWRKRAGALVEVFATAIQDGIDSGVYRSDVDPVMTASFLLGMLRAGMRHGKGTADGDHLADQAVATLERGICDGAGDKAR